MKYYWLSFVCLSYFLFTVPAIGADFVKSDGTVTYSIPGWFKESFLEIKEDSREAAESDKHVILFMHLESCPYCSRMLNENFREGSTKEYIETNYDVVAINILGDREVIWGEGESYIEKSLASELKVRFTPTVVFLNSKGQKVLQLNGYRKPVALKQALNYVKEKKYYKIKFSDYLEQQNKVVYTFRSHKDFELVTDFSKVKGPMAVVFEDKSCAGCDEFHEKVLNSKDVLEETKKVKLVRLDANSNNEIIDINGNKTTVKKWAKKLKMDYRPGTITFDNGEEISRADGRLYHFHYKELLRHTSSGSYFEYPSYNQYLRVRERKLRAAGVQIDYGE